MSDRLLFRCFFLELPLDLAPTLNEYARAKPRAHAVVQNAVDAAILAARPRWPGWSAGFTTRGVLRRNRQGVKVPRVERVGGRVRLVVVTRASSREPDELSVDVLGGKVPIDRMVHAGILVGDSRKWIERKGIWEAAPKLAGRVRIEVFDIRPAEDA